MDSYWKKLAYERHDLATCDQEPIQFCGAIQSCGWFLACDNETSEIIAASENLTDLFKTPIDKIIGLPLNNFLGFDDKTDFDLNIAIEKSQAGHTIVTSKEDNQLLTGSFFHTKNFTCIDLEALSETSELNSTLLVDHLRKLVFQIDSETDLEIILSKAAEQIRTLTGFDRVMIYRFEPNWDGRVLAESAESHLEPFLGLIYPSTDIPPQARALYFNSKYRMIVDTESEPASVLTKVGLGRTEFDLSCSSLRAVSPFHIQYLRNMGVRSSFSIPIKVSGKLWGLVACHHYSGPKHLSREFRSSCELAGQVLSGRISDHRTDRQLRIKNQILSLSQSIMSRVTDGKTPIEAFREIGPELLSMTESSGAIVRFGHETVMIGDVPPIEYVDKIAKHLKKLDSHSLWSSEDLVNDLNLEFEPTAVGAMAVPFSFGFEDLILWFRPEFVREVRWGGNPKEKATSPDKLEPRASFGAWIELVKGRSREWNESAQEAAQHLLFMFVKGIFQKATELAKANSELERVTQAKDEFIGMVSHELRTPLGVMIGWIDILKDEAKSDPNVAQAIEIIDRNAKLQINLINDLLDVSRIISGKMRINPQDDVGIHSIISDVTRDITPTADAKSIRIGFESQAKVMARVDADRLRQIVWNLLANAIKFTPRGGQVVVRLEKVASSYQISVTDTGIGIEQAQLARIFDRFAQAREGHANLGGLGLGLSIVKALVELHGGRVAALSEGKDKGSTFVATFPVFNLKKNEDAEKISPNLGAARTRDLEGVKILVAEDQPDAALALDYNLRRAGAITTVVNDGRAALEKISNESFDILLSDIGMPEIDGIELLKRLRKLENDRRTTHLPAIALTAFATPKDRVRCLEAGFQAHLSKPVDRDELMAVIKGALNNL